MSKSILRIGSGIAAMLGASLVSAPPVSAQVFDATPLSAEELDEMRGGFLLPNGVEADFGAIARTYSDGALILETYFTWTEQGLQRQGAITAPNIISTDQLANGFVLEDANGATLFAHQVDDSGVRNVLLNDANGRDLRLDTQLTVTLPGFSLAQQDFTNALLALRMFEDFDAAP